MWPATVPNLVCLLCHANLVVARRKSQDGCETVILQSKKLYNVAFKEFELFIRAICVSLPTV